MSEYILTSESVSEGHPDKVADRISDTVLDAYLARDPSARVACETLVTENYVCLAGEVRAAEPLAEDEIERLVRDAIRDIGYVDDDGRFSADTAAVDIRLHAQAHEIAAAVDKDDPEAQGAGDQGMMFGYASNETERELMPAPIVWAHGLTHRLADLRKSGAVGWLRPDAKSQVSVRYVGGTPTAVTRLVVSTQHGEDVSQDAIRQLVIDDVVPHVIPAEYLAADWADGDHLLVNPSGRFVEGGPATDTGLTGRKIIVDTYGGAARHGGGAFSGKDPSKVDRSAAYAARWAAKNVVAYDLADRCEITVAYAIGYPRPVAIGVETFGTGHRDEAYIHDWISRNFDLRPRGIIQGLDLLHPIYATTAAYGHFGREANGLGAFPWEGIVQDLET